jgi:hypothetical protein
VREEAKAGQRMTLDLLNAQQALVNARVALISVTPGDDQRPHALITAKSSKELS